MHARVREVIDHLDRQRALLRDAFEAVPVALRDRQPHAGAWSPANIVEHLAILEQRIAGLLTAEIEKARAEGLGPETSEESVLAAIDFSPVVNRANRVSSPPAGLPTGMGAADAWRALERAGESFRSMLVGADGLALGTVVFPHPLFGPISVYHWAAFAGAHEARHAAQIRESAAQV